MGNLKSIDFERCTSGIEFEGWVCDLLRKLSFPADRVGKNDSGVDIIARATWNGKVHRFYIQCKYYNKPVGKTPVHEVFAGTAFHKDYGRPVVIVNNTMTYEARRYAKELGVEIISKLAFGIDTTGTPIFKSERTETFNTLMVMNGKDVFINPKYIYKNQDKIGLYKVICTRAVSAWSGNVENVITSIRVLRSNELCTGTYSIIYCYISIIYFISMFIYFKKIIFYLKD